MSSPPLGRMRGRRWMAGLAAVAAVTLLASGCTSARNADEPTNTVTKGGTVTYAVALDALPSGIYQTLERNYPWINNVFQPIALLDPATGQPKPVLATKWELAADGLSIDITLRDDVTFHTGRKMTADDVKYTFEQAALPANGSNMAFVAKAFKAIDVKSPTELDITFTAPQPSLFEFFDQTLIVDQQTVGGLKDGSQVVGTGPFTFGDWKPGASYTLTKYPGYWGVDKVNLDKIEYVVTTDATAEISALRSGRAQMASGLTATDAQGFASGQFRLQQAGGTVYNLGLNVNTAPFTDVRVRQAVAYAIDYDRINQQVLAGAGTVADVFWKPDAPGMDDALAHRYTYNLDKAKQLLSDAGATGVEVPITYGPNPVVKAMYTIVANNLTAIGLKPVSVAVDQPTFSSKQSSGDLGAAYLSLHGQVGLGPATMVNALPPLRQGNASGFFPQEYQTLRANLLAATSDKIGPATAALTSYLLDQEPTVPIIQAPTQVVVATTIQGVASTVRGPVLLEQASIAR